MVQFIAGILVCFFFLGCTVVGYLFGKNQKPQAIKATEEEDEEEQRAYKRFRKDFNSMMGYNQHTALQRKQEVGE